MEQVFNENPARLEAALRRGKFEIGNLDEDGIKQAIYDNTRFIQPLLARDDDFTRYIQTKYGIEKDATYSSKSFWFFLFLLIEKGTHLNFSQEVLSDSNFRYRVDRVLNNVLHFHFLLNVPALHNHTRYDSTT